MAFEELEIRKEISHLRFKMTQFKIRAFCTILLFAATPLFSQESLIENLGKAADSADVRTGRNVGFEVQRQE